MKPAREQLLRRPWSSLAKPAGRDHIHINPTGAWVQVRLLRLRLRFVRPNTRRHLGPPWSRRAAVREFWRRLQPMALSWSYWRGYVAEDTTSGATASGWTRRRALRKLDRHRAGDVS